MTSAATGASAKESALEAASVAIEQALSGLADVQPRLGFLFVSPKYELSEVMRTATGMLPDCEFMASQTAGEFTERGAMRGGVVALLIASDTVLFHTAVASNIAANPEAAAALLTREFLAQSSQASSHGMGLSTTVMLLDALTGAGEQVVQGVRANTRIFQQIVGGAAGDNGEFASASIAAGSHVGPDSVAAVHIFDKRMWGVGVEHGLKPVSKRMIVTKGVGSFVEKLDGRPAFDVYRDFAKTQGVTLTRDNAGSFFARYQLGVYFLDEVRHVRAPVGVGENGELHLIASIHQGASVCIVEATADGFIASATKAAKTARANVGEGAIAGLLVFDCVFRGMVLGRDFQHELAALKEVFGDVPIAGFLSYGQVARFRGRNEGWHNSTCVVVAIPA